MNINEERTKEIQEKVKISIPADDNHFNDVSLLKQKLPQIKDALVGKPLNKVLNKSIWRTDLKDLSVCISYENVHEVYFEDFEFIIGDEVLYVMIDAPTYEIKLNNTEIETIYPTKDISVKDWAECDYKETPEFRDVSHIYSFLIGQTVADISLDVYRYDDNDEDLEAFIIHLSDGRKIKISNQDDNPWINVL